MVMDIMKHGKVPANKFLGQRIKKARVMAGLRQEDLAALIGVGQDVISKIEKGKREVSAYELGQLATVLGQPVRYFYGHPGTTDPEPGMLDFERWPVVQEVYGTMINGEPGGYRTPDTLIKSNQSHKQHQRAHELARLL